MIIGNAKKAPIEKESALTVSIKSVSLLVVFTDGVTDPSACVSWYAVGPSLMTSSFPSRTTRGAGSW